MSEGPQSEPESALEGSAREGASELGLVEGGAPESRSPDEAGDAEGVGLVDRLERLRERVNDELWKPDQDEPRVVHALRSVAQLIALTIQGFQADKLLLRASALTYITAISVIPMFGVALAIMGVVGGDETLVMFAIDQLTQVAPEVRETVREYASNLDFARFGTIGGAILFATAIFALRHLETTLNDIWGVATSRSWARRFSDYLAVMVVAPLSTGVAVSLATTLQSEPVVGYLLGQPAFAKLYGLGLNQVPVLFLFLGFTFLYWFFPNTSVRIRSAALGGLVAAMLFAAARTVYVDFQVGATTYQGVFGALSALPLILVWLYACWAVLLLGAEVAFATQNLAFARREMRRGEASPAHYEAVALELAAVIARLFVEGERPPTAEDLADRIDEPVRLVRQIIDALMQADLVRAAMIDVARDEGYVPSRPLASLTVGDVMRTVRGRIDDAEKSLVQRDPEVTQTLGRLDEAWTQIADETSLASLVTSASEPGDSRKG